MATELCLNNSISLTKASSALSEDQGPLHRKL